MYRPYIGSSTAVSGSSALPLFYKPLNFPPIVCITADLLLEFLTKSLMMDVGEEGILFWDMEGFEFYREIILNLFGDFE
jgi:hypothetical protein